MNSIIAVLELLEACRINDLKTVKEMLSNKDSSFMDNTNSQGDTALHVCAMYGSLDVLEYLIDDSWFIPENINRLNNNKKNAVHLALENGWTRCIKKLLHEGAILRMGAYSNATMKDFQKYFSNYYTEKLVTEFINKSQPKVTIIKKGEPLPSIISSILFPNEPLKRSTCIDNFQFIPASSIKPEVETLKTKISNSTLPEDYKKIALEKESTLSNNFSTSSAKDKEWIETLLKLPYGKYCSLPVSKKDSKIEDIHSFFENAVSVMESVAYGMDNVKEEILDCISQMISTNNDCMPRVICLQGAAGVGKTNFIRNGISKILNRPFKQINMGGICDGDYLIGHESTYVGSKPGMIVNSLIETKVMNPIIFMDEVDKISNSEKGIDVQSVLIHLTDPVQNSDFQDKYFAGLKIDLSKVLFVFSCNDETKISPILRDRLNIIRVKTPTLNEKVIIGKDYLLKELCPNIGIDINSVKIEADTVKYIITNFCKDDAGVRGIKKVLETLLLKINSAIYNPINKYKTLKNVKISLENPFEITIKMVEEIIKKNEDKYSELMNSMFL